MSEKEQYKQEANEVAQSYNAFGKAYHESRTGKGRLFNEYLEVPATLALLNEDLAGKTLLDAGCGSGIYATRLAQRGARVIGIDISETMINIAKNEKPAELDITYHLGNLYETHLSENSIDYIICNYVLENIHNLSAVFNEYYRILKPQGECLFSISHPLRAHAIKESKNNIDTWILENYYDKGERISDLGEGLKVKKYKRTISDYLNAGMTSGFLINHFAEPQPIPEGKVSDANAYEMAMRLPQLLLVKMIKL
ncbi:methyltransferase domain-containing protein [Candidatus Berkiella aquae]|uniref:Class I SAM-dependent methyltransferase n=1 Tax=Candidatus Berkiella aquae TaxID=295108 RepID=A0A0Q9YD32_9GAMM|nr:class I SAM-dependent methyltransferase [Candidatus Berkiella aquae]MCS5709903.1 class I SAM-dependent methyltransferase [Candidatus Berkiella aquae]